MPMQKIIYTNHAKQRMEERDISTDQIEQTIYEYDYSVSSFEGRRIATKRISDNMINVVYKAEKDTIIVITVY